MIFKLAIIAGLAAIARTENFGLEYAAPALTPYSYSAPITAVPAIAAPSTYTRLASPALQYAVTPSYAPAASVVSNAPAIAKVTAEPVISYATSPVTKIAGPAAYIASDSKATISEPSAPAHYEFGYAVHDPETGDSKSHQETRIGDVVEGSYFVVDPDGTKRTVRYRADPIHGFTAVVSKEPIAVTAPIAKVPAPVPYPAPAVVNIPARSVPKIAAPVPVYVTDAPVTSYRQATAAPVIHNAVAPVLGYVSDAAAASYRQATVAPVKHNVAAPVLGYVTEAPATSYRQATVAPVVHNVAAPVLGYVTEAPATSYRQATVAPLIHKVAAPALGYYAAGTPTLSFGFAAPSPVFTKINTPVFNYATAPSLSYETILSMGINKLVAQGYYKK